MATITEPAEAMNQGRTASVVLDEQRIVLRGISWETYKTLCDEIGDAPILKAYNQGVLELMSPGSYHEGYKSRLRRFVEALTDELGIPCLNLASTTWDEPGSGRGVEADESFLLTAEKVDAATPLPEAIDETPRPDLAIEIDMRRSGVNRAEIYASLRVPEVWRFDGRVLRIDRLREDGTYETVAMSQFLPIESAEITRWVLMVVPGGDNAWARRLREWIRGGLKRGEG